MEKGDEQDQFCESYTAGLRFPRLDHSFEFSLGIISRAWVPKAIPIVQLLQEIDELKIRQKVKRESK